MKNVTFEYYPNGKTKALTMSYDDGHVHDRRLVEIFNRYGIKGTFHLNAGKLDAEPCIGASEIPELYRGHEVSSHTDTHPFLTQIPRHTVIREILEDRKKLEAQTGYPVRGMSYPYGDYDKTLKALLPSLGIDYARTCRDHRRFSLPTDFLEWNPTCHHTDGLMEQLRYFETIEQEEPWVKMPLFYVWGHSFEFERENNWKLIEEFCRGAGGDPDVWYATNLELCDYITAMRGLKFSVENRFVFNPSCLSVWIGVDHSAVEIAPGHTAAI